MVDTGKVVQGLLLVAECLENPENAGKLELSQIALQTLYEAEKARIELDVDTRNMLEMLAGGQQPSNRNIYARYFRGLAEQLRSGRNKPQDR